MTTNDTDPLRARVLWFAMEVAAREGLAGMTIGHVAMASSRH